LIECDSYGIIFVEESTMKPMTEILEAIDGHIIIRGFDACSVDPEATKEAAEAKIAENPALAQGDRQALFEANEAYFSNIGSGRKLLTEAEHIAHKAKFDALGEHELLTETLQVIPDFRGVEYWQETNGRWVKTKILSVGETVPAGGVLPDALSAEQRAEIAAQEQADRIAALTPEAKAAEKQARIKAAIHEGVTRKQEAELEAAVNGTEMAFDPVAWVQEQKEEIEALYA
jgi:hypothetical protein